MPRPEEMTEPPSAWQQPQQPWPAARELEQPLLGGAHGGERQQASSLRPWWGLAAGGCAAAALLAALFLPYFRLDTQDEDFRAKAALSLLALPTACALERYLRYEWRRQWRRGHVRFYRRTRRLLSAPVLTAAFFNAAVALLVLWPDVLPLNRVAALQVLVGAEMVVALALLAAVATAATRHRARGAEGADAVASLGGTEKLVRGLSGLEGADALLLPVSQPAGVAVGLGASGETPPPYGRAAFERQAELIHYLQNSQHTLCKRVLELQGRLEEGGGAQGGADAASVEAEELERRLAHAEAALGEARGERDALAGELRAAKEGASRHEADATAAQEHLSEAQQENERVREMLGEWSRHCAMLEARLQAYAGAPPPSQGLLPAATPSPAQAVTPMDRGAVDTPTGASTADAVSTPQ